MTERMTVLIGGDAVRTASEYGYDDVAYYLISVDMYALANDYTRTQERRWQSYIHRTHDVD